MGWQNDAGALMIVAKAWTVPSWVAALTTVTDAARTMMPALLVMTLLPFRDPGVIQGARAPAPNCSENCMLAFLPGGTRPRLPDRLPVGSHEFMKLSLGRHCRATGSWSTDPRTPARPTDSRVRGRFV